MPSGGQLGDARAIETTLKNSVNAEVGVDTLSVPTLKVGTLDSLMSLSDDLERVDRYVESVVHRLEKEIRNLINSDANLDRETPAQVGSGPVGEVWGRGRVRSSRWLWV